MLRCFLVPAAAVLPAVLVLEACRQSGLSVVALWNSVVCMASEFFLPQRLRFELFDLQVEILSRNMDLLPREDRLVFLPTS